MSKKVIGGVLVGAVAGALAGVATMASVAYATFDYNTTVYRCEKCKAMHKPSIMAWLCGMHTPGKRFLKCPKCGKMSWNRKYVLVDKKDSI
jgi:radical SAM superfamily enzyme with C-terminal helix-hairpin-helix motif